MAEHSVYVRVCVGDWPCIEIGVHMCVAWLGKCEYK